MKKMSKPIEENKQKITKIRKLANSIYIRKLCVLAK